jgi:parvulin-like peptidyl-prolyl isomerase
MKHRLHTWFTLAFAGITLAEEPLGKLGSIELTADDLRDSILSLNEAQIASLRADPALLEQIARTSLVQKHILQEATDKKWQEQPVIVAKLARARESTITESYLESISQPLADYPTADEIKAAFESTRDRLRQPRSFRLAQIFIAEAKGAEAKITELKTRLKAKDADFASIAREHSQEPTSASRGGEIGWVNEGQIDPELRPHVEALKFAEISAPVHLKDGWHILKLLDGRAPYTPTLEQARPLLVKQLRQEKLRANTQAYLAKLLKEHPLTLQSDALIKVLPKDSSASSRP